MDHNPSNDNLERFFQRYLGEGKDIPPSDWNTPDEEVWEAVSAQLTPEPRRRRPVAWLWLVIGILTAGLATLSVVVWQLQHEMRDIKEQYAVERMRGLSANGDGTTFVAPTEVQSNAEVIPPTPDAASPTPTEMATPRPVHASDHSPKGKDAKHAHSALHTLFSSTLRSQPLPQQLAASEAAPTPNRSFDHWTGLSQKPVPAFATAIHHDQPKPHNYEVRQLKKSFARSLTFDFDYYAPLLVNFASVQSPHIILNRGYAPWSWMQGIGGQLTYRVDHRLGLSVGAYSNTLSKQFLAYSINRYDAQKDTPMPSGGIQHNTAVSVNTPVGHIREQISFRRRSQDEPLPHNSSMVVEGVMLHNLRINRVPVRLQYDLFQHNGFAITAGLGLVYNRVTTDKYDVAYNIWVKDQIVSQHVYSVNLDSPMRRHIWDGTASLQLSQRIGNQLNIHLGTAYEHSLAPIYPDPAAVNKSRMQGLQLTMGVGYTLTNERPKDIASTIH